MRECTYIEATRETLIDALAGDPRTVLIGADVCGMGGRYQSAVGLRERFGPLRVRDVPMVGRAIVGVAAGAAANGARPILDLTPIETWLGALPEIAHLLLIAPKLCGERRSMPIVLRGLVGPGYSSGPFQSGHYHPLFAHLPGLRVVAPSSPTEGKGMLAAAIACDDPVLVLEPRRLLGETGPVPESPFPATLDRAAVARVGEALTMVAYGTMVGVARRAVETLDGLSIRAELIDLRSLAPLDPETVPASVAKTGRVLLVDDTFGRCSIMSELAAQIAVHAIDYLDAPIARLDASDRPIAFSPALEWAGMPAERDIVSAAEQLMRGD